MRSPGRSFQLRAVFVGPVSLACSHSAHFIPSVMENSKKRKESEPQGAALVEKKRPLQTLRIGDCSASIWGRDVEYQGVPRKVYSVSFQVSYLGKDDKRQYTGFFNPAHLGTVMILSIQAAEVIRAMETASEQRHHDEEEIPL